MRSPEPIKHDQPFSKEIRPYQVSRPYNTFIENSWIESLGNNDMIVLGRISPASLFQPRFAYRFFRLGPGGPGLGLFFGFMAFGDCL